MIAIVNYRAGNIASVSNALQRIGAEFTVTDRIAELERAVGIVFPGVGHAASAMRALSESGLDDFLRHTDKPLLGICLGMQLLYESSEEGSPGQDVTPGLGRLPGQLKKFDETLGKVPHMGWNTVKLRAGHPLFEGVVDGSYFYHVHSYYAPVNEYTVAESHYQQTFATAAACGNVMGVQFHPEKSGETGERLLKNYLEAVVRHKV